jgi:hypothetical protein
MTIQNLGNFGGGTWWGREKIPDLNDWYSSPGSHPPDRRPAHVPVGTETEVNGTKLLPQAQTHEDEVGGAVVEAADPEN